MQKTINFDDVTKQNKNTKRYKRKKIMYVIQIVVNCTN